jgi:hypothetical protein
MAIATIREAVRQVKTWLKARDSDLNIQDMEED